MKKTLSFKKMLVAASLLTSATCFADAEPVEPKNFSIGARASTLGFGPELKYKFNSYFSARVVGNYFKMSKKRTVTTHSGAASAPIDLKGDLQMFSAGLLVDVHPFENAFHLTAGALYNGNKLDVKASHNGTVYFNGRRYDFGPLGRVEGRVDFKKLSPYLGIGSEWEFDNTSFFANAGVLFQGNARAKVTKMSGLALGAVNPADIVNAQREVEKQINKHKVIRYYPVVSLGFRIKF